VGIFRIFAKFFFGTFKGVASLFNQVENQMKIINVLLGKQAIALFILFGLNDIKFLLPETDKGSIYIKHFRYLTDGIIYACCGIFFFTHAVFELPLNHSFISSPKVKKKNPSVKQILQMLFSEEVTGQALSLQNAIIAEILAGQARQALVSPGISV
jgi:hypothetical protein